VIWLNHHWIVDQAVQVDGPVLVLNLNMLLSAAFLPFPTAVLAQRLGAGGEAARTAAALYTGVLVLLSLASLALFTWITHEERRHRLSPAALRASRVQFLVGLAIYGAAFALSWVSAPLALASAGRWRSITGASISAVGQAPTPAEPDVSTITQSTTKHHPRHDMPWSAIAGVPAACRHMSLLGLL
jgi:hypothetical protein